MSRAGQTSATASENLGQFGGISTASIALASTRSIQVGIGVLPTPFRHPIATAMEASTLAGAYGERFVLGVGLGVPGWLRPLGLLPARPLTAVRDYTRAVRELLRGEAPAWSCDTFTLGGFALGEQMRGETRIYVAAVGARMLAAAPDFADGVILSTLSSPEYVAEVARPLHDRVTVVCFANLSVAETSGDAIDLLRPDIALLLRATGPTSLTDAVGVSDEVASWQASGDERGDRMPSRWVQLMAIAGTPDEAAERVVRFGRAGADSVILSPKPARDWRRVLGAIAPLLV